MEGCSHHCESHPTHDLFTTMSQTPTDFYPSTVRHTKHYKEKIGPHVITWLNPTLVLPSSVVKELTKAPATFLVAAGLA